MINERLSEEDRYALFQNDERPPEPGRAGNVTTAISGARHNRDAR